MDFKSEIFDELQLLFETYKFNDHQLHCVICFDNKINKQLLKRAMVLTLDMIPILGSVYVENNKKPYWRKINNSKYKDVIVFADTEEEFNKFITSKIDETIGPQVKACLLSSTKDSLAVIINHMVCDAAGFKQYLYLLSDLYSKLIKNADYCPGYILNGDRSIERVNEQFKFMDKFKTMILQGKESNKTSLYKFPMSNEKSVSPFILTHSISKDRYIKIKEFCRKYKVTINDVVLAAFYRVVYNMVKVSPNNKLRIPIMVDMRRYLQDKNMDAISNLTSIVVTNIDHNSKDKFEDTVMKVNKDMEMKKSKFIGLNGFVKISMVHSIFSYGTIKKFGAKVFKNPLIGMTNIGILDDEKLVFKGTPIKNTFMCGSIKYRPYFQLALTTYKNTITLSVNLYGSSKDKENIEHFFTLLDNELPS